MVMSLFKQRRYQLATLAIVVVIAAAAIAAGVVISLNNNKGSSNSPVSSDETSDESSADFEETAQTTNPSTVSPSASSLPSAGPTYPPSPSPSSQKPSESLSNVPTGTAPSNNPSNSPTADESFGFYLMGDIPYAPWEEAWLLDQVNNMTATRRPNTLFTVHLGDFQKPDRTKCAESRYQQMRNYMLLGPLPTFMLIGDNDAADCRNPDTALSHFRNTLTNFEDSWAGRLPDDAIVLDVSHSEAYPELSVFNVKGVLFITVHLTNSQPNLDDSEGMAEWDERMAVNIEWVADAVVAYDANTTLVPLRSVVIFGHSQFSTEIKPFFDGIFKPFFEHSLRRRIMPVMYMHGDGHDWDFDDRIVRATGWSSLIDVQVDQGALADPCIVEVSGAADQKLVAEHDMQYVLANGLFRIDRQRGRFPDRVI